MTKEQVEEKVRAEGYISSLYLAEKLGRSHGNIKQSIKARYKKYPETFPYIEEEIPNHKSSPFIILKVKPEVELLLEGSLHKWPIAKVKKWLVDNKKPVLLLSTVFTGSADTHKWECLTCGRIRDTSFKSIKNNHCDRCSGQEPWTIETVKEYICAHEEEFLLAQLRSTKYKNNKEFLLWYCPTCDDTWEAGWKNIRNGQRHGDCNQKGRYNIKNAEKYKDNWLKESALVYIIRCHNDKEMFMKIGITSTTTKNRFHSQEAMPYKYEILHEIISTKYTSTYLEHYLHEDNKINKYRPNIDFEGYTECFSEINNKEIERITEKDFDLAGLVEEYKKTPLIEAKLKTYKFLK